MKKPNENAASSRAPVLGVIAFFFAAVAAQADAQVTPPARPPGSSMVVIQGGLNPDEVKRQNRAHKDKFHNKKNLMLEDDSTATGKDKSNNGNGIKK
jgi:hypothetical protein